MKIETKLQWLAFLIGMITTEALLICLGATPLHVKREMERQAVSLGYGKYVVVNTNDIDPKGTFQWITNNNNISK